MKRTVKFISILLSVLMLTTIITAFPLTAVAAVNTGETVGATNIQANLTKIKNYIDNNYRYSGNGKWFIVQRNESDGKYTYYFKHNDNDTLSFSMEHVTNSGVVVFTSIDPFNTSSITPGIRVYTGSFNDIFTASMNINVSTYNPNTEYTVYYTKYTDTYNVTSIQSITRNYINASLDWYNYYLESMVGVTLGDIGFGYFPTSVVQPTKITLNTSAVTMTAGTKYTLKATITPSDATNKTVYWSSSNPSVAGMQNGGVINAKAAGTCTITAKTANGLTATCKVTVKAKTVAATGISLNPTSMTITAGNTKKIYANITPSNATIKSVLWSSSNPSVAGMKNGGVLVAKKAGTCTITGKTVNGKAATCKVTVKAKTVAATGISLNPTSMTITAGNTKKIYANITPSNATSKSVLWSSSNPSVAGMKSGGVLVAKKAGTCTITGKTVNGKAATCKVTVKAKSNAPTGVKINYSALTMTAGTKFTLKATVTPSNAKNKTVYWSSSNTSVAGMGNGGVVNAKKAGTCTITAKTTNGKTATCKITVKAKSSGGSSSSSGYSYHLANNKLLVNYIRSLSTSGTNKDVRVRHTVKGGIDPTILFVTAKTDGGIMVELYDYFYDDGKGDGYEYTKIQWNMATNRYSATGYAKKYYTTLNQTEISASGAFSIDTYDGKQGSFPNVDYGKYLRGNINEALDALDSFCSNICSGISGLGFNKYIIGT